jgi:hypothetical protein
VNTLRFAILVIILLAASTALGESASERAAFEACLAIYGPRAGIEASCRDFAHRAGEEERARAARVARDLDEIHRRDAEMLGREMGLPPDQALREFDRLHQLSQTPWSR